MARYIGDYEVTREIGAGHFGTVYEAIGETPARGRVPAKRRLVAIKKLKDSADPQAVDLLLQEFALLEQVKHRGIVRVYEYLEGDDAVVMEHIHGMTLREVLEALRAAREQVFTEAAIEIGCELADALYQAWTTPGDNGEPLQLVHRDLKPANVMLTPQGEVKILDFGLARVDNADFAKEDRDRVKGTPIYMAPEQARGEEVDHRTDLFALGLILYELLTGEAAYRVPEHSRDPVGEVYAAIEKGELGRQCAELEARLPALGPIVTRLLQRRPEDRYQNGHELLVDLRRQLYRDRGAYLQEFCEFFFGSVCTIGDAPGLDEARAARAPARGRRLSIEERLKQSVAREQQARVASGRAPSPPGPLGPGAPPAAPGLDPRRAPPPPPAAPPPPSLGASMPSSQDNGGSGRRPVRPPVGGSASRAQPFTPAAPAGRGASGKLRQVGQRSPDETGMLEMVPLSGDGDEADVHGDPSATAFFAIPAPKADRSRPGGAAGAGPMGAPQPPPPSGALPPAPMAAPGGYGAPPPPPPGMPGGGFAAPPPPPGPMGVGAPMGQPGPMIQGPVATGFGGPVAPPMQAGATPFQVQGPTPAAPPGADAEQRVQSTRLYAILFALFVLLGLAVVAAVWLRGSGQEPEATEVVASAAPVVETTRKKEVRDTGLVAAPPPVETPKKTTTRKTTTSTTPAPAAAAPAAAPGTLTVKLADPSGFTSVVLMCPDGQLVKGTFAGGSTTLTGVPAGQSCTLSFKGGISPYRYNGAKAGQSLTCAVSGTAMVCN